MGEMVDVGPGVDSKNSPRRAAIEKAQAELRQEYYIREERKRELEFLEKGGNPLDFKVGSSSSISVQSTSITEQLVDYDAKGSSAVATSTHGDSEDSCIRPQTNLGKDSNTADNLLLINSQNSNLDGTKNELRPGKRKAISSSEHPPNKDTSNVRESEESGSFRFGVKSQAYARRNRSRPSRESVSAASARSTPSTSNNKSSVLPSPCIENKDKNDPVLEIQEAGKTVSLVSNSRADLSGKDNSSALDKGNTDQTEIDVGASEVPLTVGHTPEVDTETMKAEDSTPNQLQQKDDGTKSSEAATNSPPPSDSSVRESASAYTAVKPSLPDENINKSESVSLNVVGCPNDYQFNKHLDVRTVEEASNDIGRESSNVNPDHVSSVAMENSAVPAEDVLEKVGEKKDLETAGVDPVVGPEPVNSDLQVKIEEMCESTHFSLGNEKHESTHNSKNDWNPSCDASNCNIDSKVISEPSGLTPVNSSSATTDGFTLPEKKSSEKALGDAILKEARIIEAKMRRVNKLSLSSFPSEKHQKSHWDYLLEEMAWLANDFTQERRWKIAAASQISRQVAWAACRDWGNSKKQREIAHSMAMAVASFWELAELLHTKQDSVDDINKELKSTLFLPLRSTKREAAEKQVGQNFEDEPCAKPVEVPVLGYALRFLGCNCVSERPIIAEAPVTPERNCDSGVLGLPWEDQSTEDLFYVIPADAMKIYRESVESQWLQHQNTGNIMHREDLNSLAEYGFHENTFHEDEAEAHYFSGKFERNKSSKFAHKRKKFFQDKNHSARSFEGRPEISYGPHFATQSSLMMERRGSNTFNVSSIPTKRMRTASRQRIVSPFGVGHASQPMNSKTDASSGDTSSFQDDHASLYGETMSRRNPDIESTADFEKKLVFEGSDASMRSKKKKKQRHMGYRNMNSPDGFGISKASSYDHRWQTESTSQIDQKDHLKKRLDGHHFDSFGSHGVHGQHAAKKPKLLRHMPDTSNDSVNPVSGSHPSPAASQISSMPNTSKLIKLITSRDRNRKSKGVKMIGGQLGSGGSWSQFEDQALVVLVHDMGTNWELVSDTINSTLQFKCIFRTPIECKERHKTLMERSAGDGADSAEDSGSSQSYPSTLPGIPKGSARQLFQRLQGPMEEDTLKSHFEKIILIGRQLHFRQAKSESKETKLMTQVHSSHFHALTQACPSGLTGCPLTPLDLAEVTQSSEAPAHVGYQSSHPTASPMPTHPTSLSPSVMPSSGASSIVPGSASLAISNGLSSPSVPSVANPRDPRYSSPRPSFPVDEQQRVQQYSPLISGRNSSQQPGMSGSGTMTMGVDRVRMLSGGNSMGMFSGVNNGLPVSPRPGFQGIGSPAGLNVSSGPMLPVSGINAPSNAGQANALSRHRQPQNLDDHKQTMQDVQLQPTQPGVPMGSMSGPFPSSQGGSTATGPANPMQSFSSPQPHHVFGGNTHHHPNQIPSQHQAYAMRLAKERQQLQQRLLHQQPHFAPANSAASPQSPQPSPGSPAQHNRLQSNPRNPGGGGALNQRQRQHHPQHHPQTMPPRHLQQQQRFAGQGGLFPGSAASGQQKMYTRPQLPSRPLGPSAPSHPEVLASSQPLPRQQPIHSSQQAMQRILLQQNNHQVTPSEAPTTAASPLVDQAQVNPTPVPSVVLPSSDSAVPASGSGSQWKPEVSPQKQSSVGSETSVLQPGQGFTKRPFSGLPSNVHGVGAQWQQQKQAQQQQPTPDQSQQPPNQHNRQLPQSGPFGTNPKPV